MKVIVLGAGIIGTSSAWFLSKQGHDVTVLERQPGAAQETSFANGGQISVSHAEPWSNPAAPMKILKWLGKEDAPLLYRFRPEWLQWKWAMAFLRECTAARTDDNIRQIVILVVGARFDAAYEIYAHIAVAEKEGMKPERLATLVANLKPVDLAPDESIAFDVAYALVRGGTLPEPLYRLGVTTFGQHGLNELIYLVGLYAMVSTTLNGFNVPVPERE